MQRCHEGRGDAIIGDEGMERSLLVSLEGSPMLPRPSLHASRRSAGNWYALF